ncbi:octopamine receptor beta-1R-like [Montipora foliosa]|uniref:octopamine receptor beta-1R-like n=1 Tax=Montipora foliosa TaxID=591990 RepID=UPI0035F110FC
MALPQVIAAVQVLFNVIGFPGNFLVVLTIVLERRFHVRRYILLASLAVSDMLFLILVSSFRIEGFAKEQWQYGETMCMLNPFFARYFYINTVNHLLFVSYDRYLAIVKSPLTYHGDMTKRKMILTIAYIWLSPLAFGFGELIGVGKFVYNEEVFFCEDGWGVSGFTAIESAGFIIVGFVVPFAVILLFNWKVYKTVRCQVHSAKVALGMPVGSNAQQPMKNRQITERKAVIDVSIIIGAFLLCFIPGWIVAICRQFAKAITVPSQAVLITSCIFIASSVCNPIIYSVRKRDFRSVVKKLLRRIGIFRRPNSGGVTM